MKHIYVDESGTTTGKYLVIGSIWGTVEQLQHFEGNVQPILDLHFPNRRELKWTKLSRNKLAGYVDVLNEFMFNSGLEYRCLKLERSRIDHQRHNDGDSDLGYYKFLYQLVSKNIAKDARYRGVKDHYMIYHDVVNRPIKHENGLLELKRVLNNGLTAYSTGGKLPVRDIQPLDSKDSIFIQLTDILTGAVRYASDDIEHRNGPKRDIITLVESGVRCSLAGATPFLMEKVNIWDFRLK